MQATLTKEDNHTSQMMRRLTDEDHRAFFITAASKSQGDLTLDSITYSSK
jgi:hypothetical protein